MRAFRITNYAGTSMPSYAATLEACRAVVRAQPAAARRQVEVAEVEVATDKAGLVALLNRTHDERVIRRWQGTARGGLRLITED